MNLNGQWSSSAIRCAMPVKCWTPLHQSLAKKLRFDQQVQDAYPQSPDNCLKGLESGRLFTLFQPHQCHPPDACCTCQRILGQPAELRSRRTRWPSVSLLRIAMASTAGR